MNRLALSVLVAFGLVAGGTVALAGDRAASQLQLIQKLNGTPVYLGTVTTDAGVSQNTCTTPGTKFDAGFGDYVCSECNWDHDMKAGTCTVAATAGTGWHLKAGVPYCTMLIESQMALAFVPADAGGNGKCDVYNQR